MRKSQKYFHQSQISKNKAAFFKKWTYHQFVGNSGSTVYSTFWSLISDKTWSKIKKYFLHFSRNILSQTTIHTFNHSINYSLPPLRILCHRPYDKTQQLHEKLSNNGIPTTGPWLIFKSIQAYVGRGWPNHRTGGG